MRASAFDIAVLNQYLCASNWPRVKPLTEQLKWTYLQQFQPTNNGLPEQGYHYSESPEDLGDDNQEAPHLQTFKK